jgi:hypothetical protein
MPLPRFRYRQLLILFPAVWLAAGCQSQPKAPPAPLATPAIFTQVSHYTGTPLSGPRLAVADVGVPKDALTVSVKWIAVSSVPSVVQATLASQCRLIIAGQSDAPMLVSPDLTKGILFDQSSNVAAMESQYGGAARLDFTPVASLEGALPPNVTATFLAAVNTGPAPRNRIAIRFARSDTPTTAPTTKSTNDPVEMTLELAQDTSASTTQPSIAKSETAVFDRPVEGGHDQMEIVIPMTFSDSPARALIALIDLTPSATLTLLAKCHADLQSSAEAEAKQPNVEAVEGSAWSGYDSALKALWEPVDRRAALVFLASQTSAHICEDTALVADDAMLQKLSNTVAQRAAVSTEPHTGAALSWLLDHAAFELLVLSDAPGNNSSGAAAAAATPLPPELRAVLTVYAGEPARHSGSLDEIAQQSTSRQDLENRLTAENLVFLTDSSPASRVRAFDWLKARGLAPAGFDPLGTGKERRQALDKAMPSSD